MYYFRYLEKSYAAYSISFFSNENINNEKLFVLYKYISRQHYFTYLYKLKVNT